MKKFLIFLAVFVLVVLAALNAALLMPPTGWIKPLLVEAVRRETGYQLTVKGALSLRLVPNLNLRLEQVELRNPDAADPPLLAASAVEVRSDIWPLVRGDRNLERVRLFEPRIDLAVAKDGAASWLVTRRGPTKVEAEGGAAPKPPSVATLIVNAGSIDYRDAHGNVVASLRQVEGSASSVTAAGAASAQAAAKMVAVDHNAGETRATSESLSGTAKGIALDRIAELQLDAGGLKIEQRNAFAATASSAMAGARDLTAAGTGPGTFAASAFQWQQDGGKARIEGTDTRLELARLGDNRLQGVKLSGTTIRYRSTADATAIAIEQPTLAAEQLAAGAPLAADISFVWNKERVAGKARLPEPAAFLASPAGPVAAELNASKGSLNFDGAIAGGGALRITGKTTASTASLADLGQWLGLALPPTASGAARYTGDVDFAGQRIALTNGRFEHQAAVATGTLTVDLSGPRPAISGKLESDRLDANAYLGLPAAKAVTRDAGRVEEAPVSVAPEVSVKDALKVYMRALLAAPVTRGGAIEADVDLEDLTRASQKPKPAAPTWSTTRLDLSHLRGVDLDLDLAVKSLIVSNFDVAVPQLKTTLKDGQLRLDGRNLATRGGHLTGTAEIDARQSIPHVATSFKADGVDVHDLLDAVGVTGVLTGSSNVEADLTGNGTSQKELVESISGRVKARMGQGTIVGYDFGSAWSFLFGDRTWDPRNRTPFNKLDAEIALDNGVSRGSKVEVDGPILGATADGSVRLPDKVIDYRARFKLSSLLGALSLRIFGDWSKPSVTPDLDVFSRSPAGQTGPAEMLAGVDLADPELATLIGNVLDKRGIDPTVAENLRSLQLRAQGLLR